MLARLLRPCLIALLMLASCGSLAAQEPPPEALATPPAAAEEVSDEAAELPVPAPEDDTTAPLVQTAEAPVEAASDSDPATDTVDAVVGDGDTAMPSAPAERAESTLEAAAEGSTAAADPGQPTEGQSADTDAVEPTGVAADDHTATATTDPALGAPRAFGLLDKARLDAWLDGLVESAMLADHLPGVVVSVVEADRLVTARGWGLADVEQRRLVDPGQTLFRIGSISKVVTTTALLRLVEQGEVDLQQSVARYLDPLPFADGEAVTLTHLMTHQAGFEDGYLGHFYAVDAQTDHQLLPYLSQYPPAKVRTAGELSSYSNYSYAVLGAVIAEASGSSFEDHLDQLLGEWGMAHSSFRERSGVSRDDDMPEALAQQLAEGYRWNGWRQQRNGEFWMHRGMAPAGSMSSTAEDMTRFMRLHLSHGSLDGRQLLQTETLDRMHQVLTRPHDAVAGNAHGFWSRQLSGLRTIEHAGAVLNFHSNMVLLPEPGIGIFVSTNGGAGRQFVQDLPRLLIEQFLAARQPAPLTPAADLAQRAESYAGIYRSTRRNYSQFEAAGTLFGGDVRISLDADSGLLLLHDSRGAQAYRERSAGVFESERDGNALAFSSIADGPAARAWPSYGHVVLERVPWYARTELFWGVAGALLLLSLLRLLGLRFRSPAHGGWLEHSTAGIAWLTALGWLAFAVGLGLIMQQLSGAEPQALARYPDQQAIWTLTLGLACGLLTLICLPLCLAVWQRAHWSLGRRLHLWLFVLAGLLMLPLLWYWRLLGFHFHGIANPWLPPL